MTVKDRLHDAVESMTDKEASEALRTLAEASGDPVAGPATRHRARAASWTSMRPLSAETASTAFRRPLGF